MPITLRSAGRAAIASGIIGIIGYLFLMGYLTTRNQDPQNALLSVRIHDVCVVVQFLLWIAVVSTFAAEMKGLSPKRSRNIYWLGIFAICTMILFLLLGVIGLMADSLYMFPQGIFGIWLIIACWEIKSAIPLWLRFFGIIVGIGLALVGTFPPGFAIFVSPILLHIPAPSEEAMSKIPFNTPADNVLHILVWIGSLCGVQILPLWTIFAGIQLIRHSGKNS